MTLIKSMLHELYRRVKVRLNCYLDRIIDRCDLVLMDAYQLPWTVGQRIVKQVARYAGDVSWLLRAFPRLPAYKLIGSDWTIILVGTEPSLKEMQALLFQEADQQELERIALWRLSAQTQQWLAEGVDLVICELGRIQFSRPDASIAFTVPTRIHQVLAIPEPLESLIAGKKFATERHRLNKARRTGFDFKYSQSEADFDHFYYHMYVPYVKARHGELAVVSPYQGQWQQWFARGGLVLVTQHDKPVAGVICYVVDGTCFDLERGVLEADPQLFQQGIDTMITWYAINWARDQGAKIYNMGSTRAWRSNGTFRSKRHWGARVVRRKMIYGTWTFLARDLPPSLEAYINGIGFISEIDGKFYGVLLNGDMTSVDEACIRKEFLEAQKHGLSGLVVISPNSMTIYDSTI